jgi:hypothetical protein
MYSKNVLQWMQYFSGSLIGLVKIVDIVPGCPLVTPDGDMSISARMNSFWIAVEKKT